MPPLPRLALAVDPVRRRALRSCARAIARQLMRGGHACLLAVCTHNSRRSQLAEVWLGVALAEIGIMGVAIRSGGTEVTAVAPGVVQALRTRGFAVDGDHTAANPRLHVTGHGVAVALQSKTIAAAVAAAPPGGVIALMVCAAADASCPVVPRSIYRARLPYADPKSADGTAEEREAYLAASERIEAEMRFLAFEVKHALDAE